MTKLPKILSNEEDGTKPEKDKDGEEVDLDRKR